MKHADKENKDQAPAARRAKIDALNAEALKLREQDLATALRIAQEAYELATTAPHYPLGAAKSDLNIGRVYLKQAQFTLAQSHLARALGVFQQLADIEGEASSWNVLGLLHWRLADYPTATDYYLKALELVRSLDSHQGELTILGNLALVQGRVGQSKEALEAFNRIYRLQAELDSDTARSARAITLNNQAMMHWRTGKLDIAWRCAVQSFTDLQAEGYHSHSATVLDTMGCILLAQGNWVQAIEQFERGLQLATTLELPQVEMLLLTNLGRAYATSNQPQQALTSWEAAQHLGEKLGVTSELRELHKRMAVFFEECGDLAAALAHHKQFHALDKQIFNATADMRLKVLNVSHEVQMARERNAVLEQEIVERQQIEAALRASEEQLSILIQSSPDALFFKDGAGRWLIANPAARALFELDYEAYEGKTDTELAELHPFFRDALLYCVTSDEAAWQAGSTTRGNESIPQRDGTQRMLDVSKVPLFHPDGTRRGLVVLAHDVTAQQAAERALRQAQKMESLGILAGGIAHDFNNLLAGILGQMSLALLKLPPETNARTHVEKAVSAAERAADLTEKMLAYSGRGHFSVEPLDLNRLIAETVHLLRAGVSKSVALQSRLATTLPPIDADAGQMQQVIMNLILNGAEAAGNRSGRVLVTTGTRALDQAEAPEWQKATGQKVKPGAYVVLRVEDDGIGMSEATMPKIFDPFFSTKQSGHGLGLAAVLGIVRGHRGGIRVQSKLSEGTVFELLFPVSASESADSDPSTATTQRLQTVPLDQRYKALVIDDEEPLRQSIAGILEMVGIEVLTAADGSAGLDVYAAHMGTIHLVILDLSMPGLSGHETFRRLQQLDPDVKVLMTSGFSRSEVVHGVDGQDVAGFIQKPYRADQLVKHVLQLLPVAQQT